MVDFKFQQFTNHTLYLLNARVAELLNSTANGTDQMVVLAIGMGLFKLRLRTGESMATHQPVVFSATVIVGLVSVSSASFVASFDI